MPTTDAGRRWDPLGHDVRLAHRSRVFPLGFPLEVASNDARTLELAGCAFPLEKPLFPDAPALSLRVIAGDGEARAERPVYRASGAVLTLAGDANHVLAADLDAGRAVLWVSRATVDEPRNLMRWWIAGPVLQMLSHRAVTPVHAACVAREGRGLLLCGRPGAGKSMLARAAAEAGWFFVSDDVTYLLRSDPSQALGRPDVLRLKAPALELYPELARFTAVPDDEPAGRVYELDPARDLTVPTAAECRLAGVVMLDRRASVRAELEPVNGAQVVELLDGTLPQAATEVTEEQAASLQTLASLPCRVLRYSSAREAARLLATGFTLG